MEAIETIEYKGCTIAIHQDEMVESPREWDNLGKMCCFHSRYDLGDKHNLTVEEVKGIVEQKDIVSLPLYLYDHSGITISTTPFSCPWDSGQVGFIYVDHEAIKKEYKVKRVTEIIIGKVVEILEAEVNTYNDYLTGDVYGYMTFDKNVEIDCCFGFYGHFDGETDIMEEAKHSIDYHIKELRKSRSRKIMSLIKHNVSLDKRGALLTSTL